jgi:hypothetical protein
MKKFTCGAVQDAINIGTEDSPFYLPKPLKTQTMIIGISGAINSGKDLVGEIIQILMTSKHFTDGAVFNFLGRNHLSPKIDIKKFADKTSQAFEIITGIRYHSLDRMGKEAIRPRYVEFAEAQKEIFGDDVWVQALMHTYRPRFSAIDVLNTESAKITRIYREEESMWVITDLRFPVEFLALKDKEAITIRIERPQPIKHRSQRAKCLNIDGNYTVPSVVPIPEKYWGKIIQSKSFEWTEIQEDPTEGLLDYGVFDHTIDNDSSVIDLIKKVRKILTIEKLI